MPWFTIAMIAAVFVLIVVTAEVYARLVLGLGDPPLWRTDPDYEYILQADQNCRRLGNLVHVNQWCMRSRDVPAQRTDPDELRVLVLGDSIINGLPRIDQSDLATTRLEHQLAASLDRPVWVGNVSAGSWGPPNLLGYVRRHGLFDADVIVIVINSSDYFKQLQFRPLDPGRPSKRPVLALQEILGNYVRRRIRRRLRAAEIRANRAARSGEQSVAALHELLTICRNSNAPVIVFQHLGRNELHGEPETGYAEFHEVTTRHGIEPISLRDVFADAVDRGDDPFEDDLHPNALGHAILADALYKVVMNAVSAGRS